jgi:hypothetical protein
VPKRGCFGQKSAVLTLSCRVLSLFSLTPRLNAVIHSMQKRKPFKRFLAARRLDTRLKQDVNENSIRRLFCHSVGEKKALQLPAKSIESKHLRADICSLEKG